MVSKRIGLGAGMMIALALLTGGAAAQLGFIDGGAQAAGEAAGSVHVDGSGAYEAAGEANSQLQNEASDQARAANEAYAESEDQLYERVNETERPAMPECDCDRVFDELEQAGTMNAHHEDRLAKAAEVETGLVDAGADVSAAAQVTGWFTGLFDGARDAFEKLTGTADVETEADEDAKALAGQALEADDELRGQIVSTLDDERSLPEVEPRVDGSFAAEHATSATSSVVGQAQAGIP